MKIAVPTDDGVSICEHFGRSAGFIVFDTENGRITSKELRRNQGLGAHDGAPCGSNEQPHSHEATIRSLTGCDAVICAGMGSKAAEALNLAGVRDVFFTRPGPADAAVEAYLHGELKVSRQEFCRCNE